LPLLLPLEAALDGGRWLMFAGADGGRHRVSGIGLLRAPET